jgi:diamine N-acetyltransferase
MIDQTRQGQGYGRAYGRAAMQALIPRIQARTGGAPIFLSFEPENAVAEALYRGLGFQPTGRVEGGEIVYRLEGVGG